MNKLIILELAPFFPLPEVWIKTEQQTYKYVVCVQTLECAENSNNHWHNENGMHRNRAREYANQEHLSCTCHVCDTREHIGNRDVFD